MGASKSCIGLTARPLFCPNGPTDARNALEVSPLTKSQLQSLDFTVNRFFMKLFKTGSIEIVKQSQEYFNFEIHSVLWTKRVSKFESKLTNTDNMFCKYLV